MESYKYESTANWIGARNGIVHDSSIFSPMAFSSPPEFHGEAGLWTPEHMLVAAVASCFITTFRAIAEISRFEAAALEVTVEGYVEDAERSDQRLEVSDLTPETEKIMKKQGHSYSFTRMLVRPRLTVAKEVDRDRGLRLLEKAGRSCLVSRTLRSAIVLESTVVGPERLLEAA